MKPTGSTYILNLRAEGKGTAKFEKFMQQLRDLGCTIHVAEVGKGVIQAPPEGWILRLDGTDFGSASNNAATEERMYQFKMAHPTGIILMEGYPRLGVAKKDLLRNMMVANFPAPVDEFSGGFFGMIPTRNAEDSAFCIISLAKREQIEDNPPTLSRVRSKKKYLANAQEFFIEGLIHCGPKKAKLLLKKFDSPMAVIEALQNSTEEILEIKGFGKKFNEANKKLLEELLSD